MGFLLKVDKKQSNFKRPTPKQALAVHKKTVGSSYKELESFITQAVITEENVKAGEIVTEGFSKELDKSTLKELMEVSELGELMAYMVVNMLSYQR